LDQYKPVIQVYNMILNGMMKSLKFNELWCSDYFEKDLAKYF
jgi:hypothetical protein